MPSLLAFPDDSLRFDDENLFEIVNDERQELEPMGAFENLFAFHLGVLIENFARLRKLGTATTETLFVLQHLPRLQRRPDIAFVSRKKMREHRILRVSAWDVVPDLAVEIVSPTNFAYEIDTKLVDYFAAGVGQVWVIYPETRRLYVHESLQVARGYSEDDLINAAPVLPGFTFRLADLFDAIENVDDEPAE